MRTLGLLIFATLLTACTGGSPLDSGSTLPPPSFPVSSPSSPSQGQFCGGNFAGGAQTCTGANDYCHRNIRDICGAADAPGTCRVKPQACTLQYDPVCGCDGKTYPNECAANSQGVSAASMGECR